MSKVFMALLWREIRKKIWHCPECSKKYTKESKICEQCGHMINQEDLENILDYAVKEMKDIIKMDLDFKLEDFSDDYLRYFIMKEIAKISLEFD